MATQPYIFIVEAEVVDAQARVQDALEAYQHECAVEHTVAMANAYTDNRDAWGTLRANIQVLKARCEDFLRATEAQFK